jgi:hypothetical protein
LKLTIFFYLYFPRFEVTSRFVWIPGKYIL